MYKRFLVIIQRKPLRFSLTITGYLLVVGLIKWGISPTISAFWYLIGGGVGIYFMDLAEDFFRLHPSPFRSVVFAWGLALVGVFVVTSSDSYLGKGLVMATYLTLLLWQIGQWRIGGNLDNWYRQVTGVVSGSWQKRFLGGYIALFLALTWLFVR